MIPSVHARAFKGTLVSMIRFSCKWCGKRYKTPERNAGRSKNCKKCKKPVWVPPPYLHFSCKHCGKHFRTSPRYQGLTLPCRECGEPVTAPLDPTRYPTAPDAARLVREHGPDFSPFELTPDPDRPPALAGNLAIVPIDQLPPEGLPPPAEIIFDDDDDLPEAEPAPPQATPVVLAQTAEGSLSSLPMAELEFLKNTPLAASSSSPAPAQVPFPPAEEAGSQSDPGSAFELRSTDPGTSAPFPSAEKKKGCPRCGGFTCHVIEQRSRPGLIVMIVAALAGLICASMLDEHWFYAVATLALFGISVAASMHTRPVTLCNRCGCQLP
ncbi:MAG: hypothetical protein AB7K24_07610 [Gemmataceae bacterium]